VRLGVIVKYYPPVERVSGIIGFLRVLNRELARRCDLEVITWRQRSDERTLLHMDGYNVHRVGGPFPISAGRIASTLGLDGVVFVSGIPDPRRSAAYVTAFVQSLRGLENLTFLQATHTKARPGRTLATALRPFRTVAACSASLRDVFEAGLGRPTALLSPGVETPNQRNQGLRVKRVGFVNHMNALKGADLAVGYLNDVLDRHPSLEIVMAGSGDMDGRVTRTLQQSDRASRRGFLGEEERLAAIASCDVMLLPFRTSTTVLGVSQTALEVMAQGNVVVGSDTAAIDEAVVDDKTGLLGPHDALGGLLERVILDPDLRVRLGTNARTAIEAGWTIESRADQLLDIVLG